MKGVPLLGLLVCGMAMAQGVRVQAVVNGKTKCGNGVHIGVGKVLTVSHLVSPNSSRIEVEGILSQIERQSGGISLLRVPGLPSPSTKLGTSTVEKARWNWYEWEPKLETGWKNSQARFWCEHTLLTTVHPGQSGSGLYDGSGGLVGLVEKTNGAVWSLQQLRTFLQGSSEVKE